MVLRSKEAVWAINIHGVILKKEACTMSKIDTLRNMSAEASQAVLQEVDDTTLLQARIAILNKQEELKLKSTQEVIVLLKDLQNAIKTSVDDVRRAANTVRNYPAETAVQIAARVEETLVRCEKAGEQAQKNFEKTQRIIYDIQQLDISRLCCFCAMLGAIISGIMNIIVLYLFL